MADTVTQRNVDHVLQVKLLKNGNVCVTPDHVVLPESKLDEFLSLAKEYFSKNGLDDYVNSDQCTGIITDRHYERLVKLIKEAEETGVKSVTLGGDSPYGNAKTRAMPLTILVNPGSELAVSQEEIFGPILPVITYKDLDAAIDHINEGERPLGLYIFSDDEKETQRLINETNSGGLSVNSCAMQAALPSLGFGGSGHSGMGNHHGWEGFREFTNHRGVFRRGPASEQDLIPAFGPPFAFGEQVAAGAYQAAGM
jgi:coniferyl-aldehyde dehydrogenase